MTRIHPLRHISARATGVLLVAALLAPAAAHAVSRSWTNAAGGSAGTSTNWNPVGVPTSVDNLQFPLAATYSVSIPSATIPQVINHNYSAGVVNLSTDGTHTMTSSFGVGTTGSGGVNLTGGTIQAQSLYLGLTGGDYGRLTLVPPGGFPPPAPPSFNTTDNSQPCMVGGNGTGRLEILGGSSVTSAGPVLLAAYAAGRCTLNVAGRSNSTFIGSSFTTTNYARIGAFGTAVVKIDNGGKMRVSGITHVGNTSTGNAQLLIGTATTTFTPSFTADQDLLIGDSGNPGQLGGGAIVQVAKGQLNVGGRLSLGDPDGASGFDELLISGGSVIVSGGFSRQTGTGYIHSGGILHLAGGTIVTPPGYSWGVEGSTTRPELWIGNGVLTSAAASVFVGTNGSGLWRVVRPGTQFEATGNVFLGANPTGNGEAVIDSGGVVSAGGQFMVGQSGIGSLTVQGGGRAEGQVVYVGELAGSHGTVLVSGAGSTLQGQPVSIGASSGGPENGVATVESDGRIEATAGGTVDVSSEAGHLIVRDGGSVGGPNVVTSGLLEVDDGLLDTDYTQINATGTLRGHGIMRGRLDSYGLVDPAPTAGLFGTFETDSAAVLWPTSTLAIALGRPGAPGNDSLRVGLNLFLDGTLALEAHPSFLRVPGDEFIIATAAQVFGSFSNVTWNGNPAAGLFSVVVEPTRVKVVVLSTTLDADEAGLPAALRFSALGGTPDMAFALDLPRESMVRVVLFDVNGRQVARVQDGMLAAGTHRLRVPESHIASGMYFARAEVTHDGRTEVRSVKAVRLR